MINRVTCPTCPHCGKQFKTESGLTYHSGWAHKSTPEQTHDTGASSGDGLLAKFLRNIESQPNSPTLQQLPSANEQANLLDQIHQQMGRLQEPLVGETGTEHDLWHHGVLAGARAIFSIPGVPEANAFNDWARERNAESKNVESKFTDNWFHVPGVQELLKNYRADSEPDFLDWLLGLAQAIDGREPDTVSAVVQLGILPDDRLEMALARVLDPSLALLDGDQARLSKMLAKSRKEIEDRKFFTELGIDP